MWNLVWSTTSVKMMSMNIGLVDAVVVGGASGAGVGTARGPDVVGGGVNEAHVSGGATGGVVHVPGGGPRDMGSTCMGTGRVVGGGGAGDALALSVSEESSGSLLSSTFSLGMNTPRPKTGVLGDGIDGAKAAGGAAIADGGAAGWSDSSSFSQLASWRMLRKGGGVKVP